MGPKCYHDLCDKRCWQSRFPHDYISKEKYIEPMLLQVPPGTIGGANPSRWSNDLIFVQYLHYFINYAKLSAENKILLIMDNHESHIRIEAIKLAKENHIILLTFPPHTSHIINIFIKQRVKNVLMVKRIMMR
jgi:hypothetical protein|uniref:DDE-1 domain-containing protein n=1 Tax=Sipha flava TaxID=143950 RepID=A0A2S2Q1W9_9HEMI